MRRPLPPALLLPVLAACATPQIASTPSSVAARVPFLRAGETRWKEALDRLGEPAHRHGADGVYVWLAGEDQDGRLRVFDAAAKPFPVPASWPRVRYELVLQFDQSDAYVRGSLVHAE